MPRMIFVNLPIANLKVSVDFFAGLGFTFNAQFTSEDTTCMIVNELASVMLLEKKRFAEFTPKTIVDATQQTECLIAVSCDSRAAVEEMMKKALSSGGTEHKPPQDMGFMYSHSFQDPDGHVWEPMWMNPAHVVG